MRRCFLALLCAQACAAAGAQDLTVSAAASLGDALRAIAPGFVARHPGARLRLNLASSGQLLQQIAQGAPADVFASADAETMDRAAAQGLIDPATRHDFTRNRLVLVAPPDSSWHGLASLASPAVQRVAIGKPATVPAGRYAQQVLEAARLWDALAPKRVPADHVRQVLDYVARGEVDAGFVYQSDALAAGRRVRVVQLLQGHAPIHYPVAVVQGSSQPRLAQAFVDYLRSPGAQALLQQKGFGSP